MGDIRINFPNVITISLVGFVGVFIINRALRRFGMPQYATA